MTYHTESDDKRRLTGYSSKHPSAETHVQRQTKPTTQSSTSGPISEGENHHDQQGGFGNSTFFAGTAAYTQYGVEETFDPEPQRPSADRLSRYKSTIEHRDLPAVGLQAFGASSLQQEPRTARMEEAVTCPYHGPILQERPTDPRSGQGLGPMDRYLVEGPSERYAIVHRHDAANVSTHNGCRCLEMAQNSIDTKGHAQK